METPFTGNAAFLNGTELGTALFEISKIKLLTEPEDPQLALIERIRVYSRLLDERAQAVPMEAHERDHRLLRKAGLWNFLGNRWGISWKERLSKFLAGVIWQERDTTKEVDRSSMAA